MGAVKGLALCNLLMLREGDLGRLRGGVMPLHGCLCLALAALCGLRPLVWAAACAVRQRSEHSCGLLCWVCALRAVLCRWLGSACCLGWPLAFVLVLAVCTMWA